MNKIYKVLWNAVRSNRVVTSEAATAHGKGKQAAVLVAAALAAMSGGAQAATAITPADGWGHTTVTPNAAGTVFDVTTNHVQSSIGINHFANFKLDKQNIANLIHPKDATKGLVNFVNTKIEINGTVNSIKDATGAIGGDLYFVSPQGFAVGATGVINTGSLTVTIPTASEYAKWTTVTGGAMTAVTADLLGKMQAGSADIPLNPQGIISVSGSINAGNRVTLAAAGVMVGAKDSTTNTTTGSIDTTVTDFSQLVNIADADGKLLVSAGDFKCDYVAETTDTGDVMLVARSQQSLAANVAAAASETTGTTDSVTTSSAVSVIGKVTAKGAFTASAATTIDKDVTVADLGFTASAATTIAGEVSAKSITASAATTVAKGTTVTTTGDKGDVVLKSEASSTSSISSSTVTSSTVVSGTVTADGDIEASSSAKNVLKATKLLSTKLPAAMEKAILGTEDGDQHAGWANLATQSTLTIKSEAALTAGGDVSLENSAETELVIGKSSGDLSLWDNLYGVGQYLKWMKDNKEYYDSLTPAEQSELKSNLQKLYSITKTQAWATVVTAVDNKSTLTVEGSITAGNAIDIENSASLDADVNAVTTAAVTKETLIDAVLSDSRDMFAAATINTLSSTADLTIAEGAVIVIDGRDESGSSAAAEGAADDAAGGASEDALAAGTVKIVNEQTANVSTSAEAVTKKDGDIAITLDRTSLTTSANLKILNAVRDEKGAVTGGGITEGVATLDIENSNITESFSASAATTDGVSDFLSNVFSPTTYTAYTDLQTLKEVKLPTGLDPADLLNLMVSASGEEEETFDLGGAVTSVTGDQSASLLVAAPLSATGDVTIQSEAALQDHNWLASGTVGQLIKEEKSGDTTKKTTQWGGMSVVKASPATVVTGKDADGKDVTEEKTFLSSSLVVGDGLPITAGGSLTLSNSATIDYGSSEVVKDANGQAVKDEKGYNKTISSGRLAAIVENLKEAKEKLDEIWSSLLLLEDTTTKAKAAAAMAELQLAYNDALSAAESYSYSGWDSLWDFAEAAAWFGSVIKAYKETLVPEGRDAWLNVVFDSIEALCPTSYLQASAQTINWFIDPDKADSTDNDEKIWGAEGQSVSASVSTASTLVIGKKTQLTATDITISGTSLNTSVAAAGYVNSVAGVKLPTAYAADDEANAVGSVDATNSLVSVNNVYVREGAAINASGAVLMKASDGITATVLAGGSDMSLGNGLLLGDGLFLSAVNIGIGSNRLSIDDEAIVQGTSVTLAADRSDSFEAVSGSTLINSDTEEKNAKGETISSDILDTSSGLGLAVNVVVTTNTLAIENNDVLSDGEASVLTVSGGITTTSLVLESGATYSASAMGAASAGKELEEKEDDSKDDSKKDDSGKSKLEAALEKKKDSTPDVNVTIPDGSASGKTLTKVSTEVAASSTKVNEELSKVDSELSDTKSQIVSAYNENNKNSQALGASGQDKAQEAVENLEADKATTTDASSTKEEADKSDEAGSTDLAAAGSVAINYVSATSESDVKIESSGFAIETETLDSETTSNKWISALAGASALSMVDKKAEKKAEEKKDAASGGTDSGSSTKKDETAAVVAAADDDSSSSQGTTETPNKPQASDEKKTASATGVTGAVALNLGTTNTLTNWQAASDASSGTYGLQLTLKEKEKDGKTDTKPSAQILSVSDGTILAEGLSTTSAKVETDGTAIEGSSKAFDMGVSVSQLTNNTSVAFNGLKVSGGDTSIFEAGAWTGDTQVTGGTGFGLAQNSGTGGSSKALGAIVAVAKITNNVTANLTSSQIEANRVSVRALESVKQVTTALGIDVTTGNSGFAFSGVAATSIFTNTVLANASNASVTLAGKDAGFDLAARDARGDEKTAYALKTNASWTTLELAASDTTNTEVYKKVQLAKDEKHASSQAVSAFHEGAGMLQTTVAVSLAAAGESSSEDGGDAADGDSSAGGSSAGAAVLVNDITNDFQATSTSLTLSTKEGATGTSFSQTAESNVVSIGVVTGASGGKGLFAAAGSVLVSNVDQKAAVTSDTLKTSGIDAVRLQAGNKAKTVNVAGNVGVSVGGKGVAAGASVLVMNTNNTASVTLKNSTIAKAQEITLQGISSAETWGASADGTVKSGLLSFGGAVAVNRANNITSVEAEKDQLNSAAATVMSAADETELWTLAGNVAVTVGAAGASGAVAYTSSGRSGTTGTSVMLKDVSLVPSSADSTTKGTLAVTASAKDKVRSMALGVGASTGAVGFGGAAVTNEINRTVRAETQNLATESLASAAIQATSVKDIGTLAINGGGSTTAGVGVGVAVNRINATTEALMSGVTDTTNAANSVVVKAGTVLLRAASQNNIETIGVGGAGGGVAGVTGSTAVNLVTDDTYAKTDGAAIEADSTAALEAVSDNTIGTYGGQGSGGGAAGVGLAATVSQVKGNTQAVLQNSSIKAGSGTDALTVEAGVADDKINDKIVNTTGNGTSAYSITSKLRDDRTKMNVNGVSVGATSTTNYKNLSINGGGAGVAGVVGTGAVIYHGGDTGAKVEDSTLESGHDVRIFSGDYLNADTSVTTAAGAGVAGVVANVNVITTERQTTSEVNSSTLKAANAATVKAEAKEGLSALRISAAGAGAAGVGAGVNVTRMLSGVNATVTNTKVTSGTFAADANYLGRVTPLSVGASGAGAGAGGVGVNITYADNDVATTLSGATITTTGDLSVTAERRNEMNMIDVTALGAGFGALAGTVLVNTIDGTTTATVESGSTLSSGSTLTITAENYDQVKFTTVSATVASVSGGATVVVNRVRDDAAVNVLNSALTASSMTLKAQQTRDINTTGVFASAGLGTLGANVASTLIGDESDPFASDKDKDTEKAGNGVNVDEVNGYQSRYAGSDQVLDFVKSSQSNLHSAKITEAELASISESVASATNDAKVQTGTAVKVESSTLVTKTGAMSVTAEEKDQVSTTIGGGSGGAVALSASVGTLRLKRQAGVWVTNSVLDSKGAMTVGARALGTDSLNVYQASVAMASGAAAVADAKVSGLIQTTVENSTLQGDGAKTVGSEDVSQLDVTSMGIQAGGIAAGAMLSFIKDKSSVETTVTGHKASGGTSYDTATGGALTISADRNGRRNAYAAAGSGGGLTGVGAKAKVEDLGNATMTATSLLLTDAALSGLAVESLNRPQLFTKSYGVVAGGLSVGVVQTVATATGKATATVSDSTINVGDFSVFAGTGYSKGATADSTDLSTEDALTITALSQGYGGSVVQVAVNSAEVKNSITTTAQVTGSTVTARSATVNALGFSVYKAFVDSGSGGVVSAGSNKAKIENAGSSKVLWNNKAATLGSVDIDAYQLEMAYGYVSSAGGGLVDASVDAARTDHVDTSSATVEIASAISTQKQTYTENGAEKTTSGSFAAGAATLHLVRLAADNTKGALAGGSGAVVENSLSGSALVKVNDGVALASAGTMDLWSGTQVDATAAKEVSAANLRTFGRTMSEFRQSGTYATNSAVYGAIAGSGIKLSHTQNRTAQVLIGKNAELASTGNLTLAAQQINDISWRSRSRSAGLISGVTASVDNTMTLVNDITVGEGATVKTTTDAAMLTLSASTQDSIYTEAVGDLQGGVAGGTGAKATNTYNRTESVTLAAGSLVLGAGDVNLYAGRNAQGADSTLDFETYTHAYSHALIAGADSEFNDRINLTSTLNVAGAVEAVKDISAAGTKGTVNTKESARYWLWTSAADAGTVRIASTGLGTTAEDLVASESIIVNGSLLAGKNTKADVTISGIVLPGNLDNTKLTVEGSQTAPTVSQSGVKGDISTSYEDLANVYWARYQRLQQLVQEYGEKKTEEDRQILVAYRAEMTALQQKMISEGYAERDSDGSIRLTSSEARRDYVKVSGITVSGGSVDLTTGSVMGAGSITANAAEHINITNNSTLALKVENVTILEKGGDLTLNGIRVTEGSTVGTVTAKYASTTADPTMTIVSQYNASADGTSGAVTVKYTADGVTQTRVVTPDTSIEIIGTVENAAGNLTVTSGKDISVPISLTGGTNRLAAAGSLMLNAKGAVTQSYTTGVTNVGGDPSTLWQTEVDQLMQSTTTGATTTSSELRSNASSAIVGGTDVIISGEMINLNGLVQSGYAQYGIELSENELNERVSAIKAKWTAAGCPSNINATDSAYSLTQGGSYKLSDGTYAYQAASWYDPVSDQILVEDITPTGGHIIITGKIASTGNGKLVAADGQATVKIEAGSHNVQLGDISTGSVSGSVKIVDTNFTENNGTTYDAKVTEYSGGKTTVSWQKEDGTLVQESVTDGYSDYAPLTGQRYAWSTGSGTVTYFKREGSKDFYIWGLYKKDEILESINPQKTTKPDKTLSSDKTVSVMTPIDGKTDEFVGWVTVTNEHESAHDSGTYTEYDNWTHFSGTTHAWETWSTTQTNIYTFALKADHEVSVGTTSGNNSVMVTTTGTLTLGGAVTATGGSVSLTGAKGITAASSDAGIFNASSVTLSAAEGAIGSAASAIRISGSEGALALNASAKNDIVIDASALAQNAKIGSVSAEKDGATTTTTSNVTSDKGNVTLKARGDIDLNSLAGSTIKLASTEGSIRVANLAQHVDAAGAGERFDASALKGSVSIENGTSDIYVGRIEALDAVSVTTTGALYDALDRSDLDDRTTEERIQSWKDAGLLDENGNAVNRYTTDLANAENAVKNDFARYQAYLENEAKTNEDASKQTLTNAQQSDYATLKTRFAGCADAEAAVAKEKADSSTNLYKVAAGKDNYGWSADDLLYAVADSVINPKAAASTSPDAKDANISAKTVTLATGTGIGQDLATETIQASQIGEKNNYAFLKKLARAESGDLSIKLNEGAADDTLTDYTLTLNLKRSVSVHLTDEGKTTDSSVSASATAGNIYIESAKDDALRVKEVTGTANVTLNGANGIVNAADAAGIIGKNIVLNAHLGSIGTAESAVLVKQLSGGWTQLTAAKVINVQSDGKLDLYSVSSNSAVNISADKIRAWHDAEDVSSLMGYISAGDTITLTANGIGLPESDSSAGYEAIRVDGASSVVVKSLAEGGTMDGVYLVGTGAGTLTVTADGTPLKASSVALTAFGELDDGQLKAAGHLAILGSWEAGSFSAIAAGDITAQSTEQKTTSITTTASSLLLSADNIRAAGLAAQSAGDLTISADKAVDLENAQLAANGDVVLEAEAGTLNAKNLTLAGTVDDLTVTAGQGDIDFGSGSIAAMTGALSVTAAAGSVKADGRTLKAASVKLTGATGVSARQSTIVATAGDVLIKATKGDADVSGDSYRGAVISATAKEDGSGGKVAVEAAEGAVKAGYGSFTAAALLLKAAGNVTLDKATIQSDAEGFDADVKADGKLQAAGLTVATSQKADVSLEGAQGVEANLDAAAAAETGSQLSIASSAGNAVVHGTIRNSAVLISAAQTADVSGDDPRFMVAGASTIVIRGSAGVSAGSAHLGSTGATEVSSASGAVSANSLTVSSGGLAISGQTGVNVQSASISSTDGVTIRAASGDVDSSGYGRNITEPASIKAANDVVIEAAAGSVTAANKIIEAGGALTIAGANGVDVSSPELSGYAYLSGPYLKAAGALTVASSAGNVTATKTLMSGGSATISGQTGVSAKDASITTISGDLVLLSEAGDVNVFADLTYRELSAAGNLRIQAKAGKVSTAYKHLTAGQSLTIEAAKDIEASKARLTATEGNVSVSSAEGKVVLTEGSLSAEKGEAALTASKEAVTTDGSTATVKTLAVSGAAGVSMGNAKITASDSVKVASENGDIAAYGSGTRGDMTITAANAVTMTAEAGSVDVHGKTIEAGTLQLSGASGVNAASAKLKTTAGALSLASSQGSVAAEKLAATAKTALSVDGNSSVTLSSAVLAAEDDAEIKSTGTVTATSAEISAASATMEGKTGVSAKDAAMTATSSDIKVVSEVGDVEIGTWDTSAALMAESGVVMLQAKVGKVSADRRQVNAQTVQIEAAGNVSLQSARLTANDSAAVASTAGQVTAGSLSTTAGSLNISGAGGVVLSNARLNETGTTTIASSAGTVQAHSAQLSSSSATISGSTGVAAHNVEITATGESGDIVIRSEKGDVNVAPSSDYIAGEGALTASGDILLEADAGSVLADRRSFSTGKSVTISGATGVSMTNVDVKAGNLSVTAAAGDIDAHNNASGDEVIEVTKAVALTAKSGSVDVSKKTITAGTVSIAGAEGVKADSADITATEGGISLASSAGQVTATSLVANANTALEVMGKDGVTLTSANLTSTGMTEISSKAGSVSADSLTAAAGGLSITGSQGVSAKNASVTSTDGVTITAGAGNVDVSGSNAIKATNAVAITAENGAVNAASKTIEAKTATIEASGSVDVSNANIQASDSASVKAGGSLAMQKLTVSDTGSLTLVAGAGDVNLNNADIGKVSDALTVTAAKDILAAGETINAGTVTLTAGNNVELASGTISSQGDVSVAAGSDINANSLTVAIGSEAGGNVSLVASGEGHLQNASITGTVNALAIEGDKSLDLSGAATGSATEGKGSQLTAGTVTLKTNGTLDLGNTGATVTATSGDLTINAGTLTLAKDSTLTSEGKLTATVTEKINAADGFKATGASISITGGDEEFKFASGSTFTSTDGGIDLISTGNLTLGGSLNTSATTKTGEDATIRIGSEGVLSVTEDKATITAEHGSVVVVGMSGMNIRNDLTVLSTETAMLYSEAGSVTIGNGATVVAGSAAGHYGDVVVAAGEDISIGDDATLLSDNLTIAADDNVTFGTNATLVGTTDGVVVNAAAGSITMGENLTVVSNAEATNFNAGLDIVVDQAGELYSEANDVNLRAQRDVIFGNDFDVYSKKFTMAGGRDVTVGANASVETHFAKNEGGDPYSTAIVAGRNVTFGDNAKFFTTDVNIVAGLVEKEGSSVGGIEGVAYSGEKGSLTFGKNSTMETTHRGIEVLAVGDITFDDAASFVTYSNFTATAENSYAIDLVSEQGDIRLGHDATIATRKSAPIYVLAGSGSVTLGDRAGIGDFNENESGVYQIPHTSTAVISASDGVTFGSEAFVWSGDVLVKSANGSITTGDNSFFAGADRIVFDALKTVTFDGNILLASDKLVDVKSREGDILMNITSSEVLVEGRVEEAKFTAAGSVIQTGPAGARGISAEKLTITAGNDVLLGIVSEPADTTMLRRGWGLAVANNGGNDVGRIDVTAGGDVALTISSDDALVAVNTAANGVVNGRLSVKSDGGSITFEHDQSAQSIGVYAGNISAEALTAVNELELATAPYDVEGVSLTAGKLAGGSVSIRLGKGTTDVQSVAATAGSAAVIRLSNAAADVVIPTITATDDLILMNAGGRVTGDKAEAGRRAYIIGATKAADTGFAQFTSAKDPIYLAGAESLAERWNAEWIRNLSAVDLKAGMLSVTLLSEHELIDVVRTTDRVLIDPAKRWADEGIRFLLESQKMTGPAGQPGVVPHRVTDFWTDGTTKLLQREAKPAGEDVVPLVVSQNDKGDFAI